MHHPNTFRRSSRVLLALGAALATVLAVSVPAQAEGNVVFREHVTEKVSHIEQEAHGDAFCDVPFLVRFDGIVTVTESVIRKGGGDLEYYSFRISGRNTYTNVETGVSFRDITTFADRDQKVAWNDDGTLTVDFMDTFSTKLFGPDGRLVGVDAGTFAGMVVIDLNDPENPDDDEILSETVTRDHGVRTFGDRDFCADVALFLG